MMPTTMATMAAINTAPGGNIFRQFCQVTFRTGDINDDFQCGIQYFGGPLPGQLQG